MPKYLVQVQYTLDGLRGVKSEGGSARVAAATAAIEEQGGKVEAFYFAFGENDAYVVVDMPDNVVGRCPRVDRECSGRGAAREPWCSSTADEMDAASKRKTLYRPPGS